MSKSPSVRDGKGTQGFCAFPMEKNFRHEKVTVTASYAA